MMDDDDDILMKYLLASSSDEELSKNSGSMHDNSSSMDETSDDNSTDDDATSSRTARSTYDGPSSRTARLTWAERHTQVENSSFNSYLKNADENEMDGTGVWDPTCYEGRQFRRRFRVPYTIFLELVEEYKLDCSKLRSTGPYDERLLVLGALRVLGSGSPFDLIEELNCIDKETNRKFFHRFVNWGRRESSKWIYLPRTEAEICHVVDVYKSLGYPGALGSADGVHFYWDKCPAGLSNACTGKEKLPTLAFQFVVSHTKWIMSVTNAHFGTDNDKTISRYDQAIIDVREGGRFSKYKFELYTGNNDDTITEEGLYYIVDGGYHTWGCLICPFKIQQPGTSCEVWSSALESIRKDVECTFGILKVRFLILKHPLRLHDMEVIEDVVHTCAMIHNRLMQYDDRDDWDCTGGVDGGTVDYGAPNSGDAASTGDGLFSESAKLGPIADAVLMNATVAEGRCKRVSYTRGEYRRTHTGVTPFFDNNDNELDEEGETSTDDKFKFDRRRQNLIRHYQHMKRFAQRHEKHPATVLPANS
jgi:hypothetical protein